MELCLRVIWQMRLHLALMVYRTGPIYKNICVSNGHIHWAYINCKQIYNQKGYFVLVRGDRSVYTSGCTHPTILRTKGQLFTPANLPPSTTVLAGKFESVGNPYASAIDLRSISKTTQDFHCLGSYTGRRLWLRRICDFIKIRC